jgi:hypothetical protein
MEGTEGVINCDVSNSNMKMLNVIVLTFSIKLKFIDYYKKIDSRKRMIHDEECGF